MWWLQFRHSALASLLAVSALVTANGAVASTITFDDLAGTHGADFTGYTESGFTVSPGAVPSLFVGKNLGNPVPDIYGASVGSISVTSASGLFSFNSIDLAGNNGNADYLIVGTKTGTDGSVFSLSGSVSNTMYATVSNNDPALIDSLSVTIFNSATTFNIDNINVTAVPVPAAVWLFGSGLVGLAGIARKRA